MNLDDYISCGKKAYDYFKDGIIITDNSFDIIYCNQSAIHLFGYSRKAFEGKTLIEIARPVISIITSLKDKSILNSKKIAPRQLEFIHKSKTKFKALTFISNLGDKESSLGYMTIIQDAASAAELNANFVFDRMPYLRALNSKNDEFFYISDLTTGRNIFCSDSVEKFLGWEANNFVNGSWAFAISKMHPDDVVAVKNYYKKRERWYTHPYKFDHNPLTYKYRMLHKKGYYVHVKVTATLLQRNKKGGPLYAITFGKTYQPKKQADLKNSLPLTIREIEVLQLLENGKSYKMVASELHISINSVRTYIRRLYGKLQVNSVTEAIHKLALPNIKSL